MEPSLEKHMPVTNGGAIDWYRSILINEKISEEKIKTEAGKFVNLSVKDKAKDEKSVQNSPGRPSQIPKEHGKNLVREILKAKGGQGKHCENPPRDFLSDVDCEKNCHFLNQQEMK